MIVDASGACVTAVFNFDTTDQATAREYRLEVCYIGPRLYMLETANVLVISPLNTLAINM